MSITGPSRRSWKIRGALALGAACALGSLAGCYGSYSYAYVSPGYCDPPPAVYPACHPTYVCPPAPRVYYSWSNGWCGRPCSHW